MTHPTPPTAGTAVNCEFGIAHALDAATRLNCSATQIMFRPPMSYERKRPLDPEDAAALEDHAALTILAHASLWCVLTRDPAESKQYLSSKTIAEDLRFCEKHGVQGTVVHPGSWRDASHAANCEANLMTAIRLAGDGSARVLLENSASAKSAHASLAPLAAVVRMAAPSRAGICLDTAHAIAAGIDLCDPLELEMQIAPYADLIHAVHFNNPRNALGSSRDGHGRLSEGSLSMERVKEMHHLLRDMLPSVPFIIEVTDRSYEVDILHSWDAIVSHGLRSMHDRPLP
jgi:deoxyribonuclease-4